MEGSKVIRYWDKDARIIKVSRNFTFSKNGELKELQVTKIAGLGAEGLRSSFTTTPRDLGHLQKNSCTTLSQPSAIPRTHSALNA